MRRSPLLALLLTGLLALGAAGCGEHDRLVADTEGLFIQFHDNDLIYQVPLSRQLNPFVVDDRAYFIGIPPQQRILPANELWFGVFLRTQNVGTDPEQAAREFAIVDTQENVYRPVTLDDENPFAYRPEIVQEDEQLPRINSAAHERPPNGALLLFRLERDALNNRPLELRVASPDSDEVALINLDV